MWHFLKPISCHCIIWVWARALATLCLDGCHGVFMPIIASSFEACEVAQHPRPTVLTKFGRLVGPVSSNMFVDDGSKDHPLPHNIHPSIRPPIHPSNLSSEIVGRPLTIDCRRSSKVSYLTPNVLWIAIQGCYFTTIHGSLVAFRGILYHMSMIFL